MMKVSIITATYNSIQYISNALESIHQQTYPNIEYIIIDGGSTDGTVEYLKQSPLVSQIISEKDKGIYDAINKGIQLATGDIIGFLHSADMLATPKTIENIVRAFNSKNPDEKEYVSSKIPDVIYGNLVFVDQHNTRKVIRYWKSRPFKPYLLNHGWMPAHPTVFMRKEVYAKHGLYNINLRCASDYEYMLRVFRDQSLSFYYLPEVISKMRRGGISNTGIKNLINKRMEDYWVLKNNQMPFPIYTLFAKNISKIPQLIFRKQTDVN